MLLSTVYIVVLNPALLLPSLCLFHYSLYLYILSLNTFVLCYGILEVQVKLNLFTISVVYVFAIMPWVVSGNKHS